MNYKVRVINSEAATAAGVRVIVESQGQRRHVGSVGVSENVIEASWIASSIVSSNLLHKKNRQKNP